jgi:hypothetical protein
MIAMSMRDGSDELVPGQRAETDKAAEPGGPDLLLHERLMHVEKLMHEAGHRILKTPSWLRPHAGEARWPVAVAVLVAIGLQFIIPNRFTLHPFWLLPALELGLLVLLIAANPRRIEHDHRWIRVSSLALVAVASFANAYSALLLVRALVAGSDETKNAGELLIIGGGIWLTNVIVFGLWYWEFDRGGPVQRTKGDRLPDFQFPQMQTPDITHDEWTPTFVDYLYLSFTNAMAFSPTDTLPLNRWAKLLMLSQSLISLLTVALVIARAVNILQ